MTDEARAMLVSKARDTIAAGSQSFAAASKLFAPETRARAWLLYAWCRAADDITDGQELGHAGACVVDAAANQQRLTALTNAALTGGAQLPVPFAALRQVARETGLPHAFVHDHLAGFALDAEQWRPNDENDLLQYCYHVAGTVGCMMAVVMGVPPDDHDTLDRACDLGLAFQLANIARDIVSDAGVGRCYIPAKWLAAHGITEAVLAEPQHREALIHIATDLVALAQHYRVSARVGAARLPLRSRLAVLSADAIYGAIGESVVDLGSHAWDERVRVPGMHKFALFLRAALRCAATPKPTPRTHLWTRPRKS